AVGAVGRDGARLPMAPKRSNLVCRRGSVTPNRLRSAAGGDRPKNRPARSDRAGSGRDLRPSGRGVDSARSDLGRRESSERQGEREGEGQGERQGEGQGERGGKRQGERQGAQGDVSAALAAIAAPAQSIQTVAAVERVGTARDDYTRADGRTAAVLSDDRR